MPITRVNPKGKHLRVVRDTDLYYTNKPALEKQPELIKQKMLISATKPFWKKWFAFFKTRS